MTTKKRCGHNFYRLLVHTLQKIEPETKKYFTALQFE